MVCVISSEGFGIAQDYLPKYVILSEAKDLVFRVLSHLYPNNEILRRFAPQSDINRCTILST